MSMENANQLFDQVFTAFAERFGVEPLSKADISSAF